MPGDAAIDRSQVTSGASSASARATEAASHAVRFFRSSRIRPREHWLVGIPGQPEGRERLQVDEMGGVQRLPLGEQEIAGGLTDPGAEQHLDDGGLKNGRLSAMFHTRFSIGTGVSSPAGSKPNTRP